MEASFFMMDDFAHGAASVPTLLDRFYCLHILSKSICNYYDPCFSTGMII
ncbi:hypothetical protein SDC9_142397 [bioreactor metagenome]|uniref:Uncharacterized protein n=1 Tax=bioreactor metagenome TaxID=1076179 RepID=A0A645E359_9ZZZZ